MNLILTSSEAIDFCNSVENNLEKFHIKPSERFSEFRQGVFATTGVDLAGERIDLQSLEILSKVQNSGKIHINFMHNPTIPPVGRVIASKVFWSQSSNIHFLAGVMGIYSKETYEMCSSEIIPIEKSSKFTGDIPPESISILFDDTSIIDGEKICFNRAPEYIDRNSKRLVNKSFVDSNTLQLIIISGTLVLSSTLGGFFNELGKDIYKWLKEELFVKLKETRSQRLLGVYVRFGYLQIEAYIDILKTADPQVAFELLSACFHRLESLAALPPNDDPFERIVIEYDSVLKKWILVFTIQKSGRISTSRLPPEINFEVINGLSIGALSSRK